MSLVVLLVTEESVCLCLCVQLLAVFMQLGARELLMHYMDLKQTNDVQLTFEALKVPERYHTHTTAQKFGHVTRMFLTIMKNRMIYG